MLVALVRNTWTQEKRDVILSRRKALAIHEGQRLLKVDGIKDLVAGEELWLYSHGGETTFCGMVVDTLDKWLVRKRLMPAGSRRIVLKGCRTATYARELQAALRLRTGYENVTVVGFAGVRSYTTVDGEMQIEVETPRENKKADRASALAEIATRRSLTGTGTSRAEVEKEVTKARTSARREVIRHTAVLDEGAAEGTGEFVALDDRMSRRVARDETRQDLVREREAELTPPPPKRKRKHIEEPTDDTADQGQNQG
ncbi:hypothetical protein [Actinosynnema sp. NPDC020468]|uniref:hypothetical protein n=1 Tax=Actinosynnema sp. NPDC020468 TaxID=3154488 RepID=UPI0033EB1614